RPYVQGVRSGRGDVGAGNGDGLRSVRREVARASRGGAERGGAGAIEGSLRDAQAARRLVFRVRRDGPSAPEIAEPRLARQIGFHVLAAALVDDLASHGAARVGGIVAVGGQRAAHAVGALTDHDFDRVKALAVDHHFELLAGRGGANFDLFV